MGWTRSNYFRCTDPEKLESIVSRIITDGYDGEVFSKLTTDDEKLYAFCVDGTIFGLMKEGEEEPEDEDYNAEDVYSALQEVIPEGEAIVVEEVGHEGLSCLAAFATIITRHEFTYVNMMKAAEKKAGEMLGGDFILDDEY